MRALVDTNVIARSVQPKHPAYASAMLGMERLRDLDIELCIATQSLFELYVVATRPESSNGLGIASREVLREIQRLEGIFTVIPESPLTYPCWVKLMNTTSVIGKSAHDGRLVATMLTNNIPMILTFNVNDFTRYALITVRTPEDVLTGRI